MAKQPSSKPMSIKLTPSGCGRIPDLMLSIFRRMATDTTSPIAFRINTSLMTGKRCSSNVGYRSLYCRDTKGLNM